MGNSSRLNLFAFQCLILLFFSQSLLAKVPVEFVYQGKLMDDNQVPWNSIVDFKFQIYDPTLTCLLYEERQSDISLTNGMYSVLIGSEITSSKRSEFDPGLEVLKIFSNEDGAIRDPSSTCVLGYSPQPSDKRKLKVTVTRKISGEVHVLSPVQEITMNPFALVASQSENSRKFQGKVATEFIQVEGNSVTQSNVKSLTDKVVEVLALVNGGLETKIAGKPTDSSVTNPGSAEDGKVLTWSHTQNKYVLVPPTSNALVSDATSSSKGVVQVGSGLAVSGGIVSAAISNSHVVGNIDLIKISGRGAAAAYDVPVTGDAGTSQLVKGDDSRLVNTRVPIDNSVTTAKIGDLQVTNGKIASVDSGKITGNFNGSNQLVKLDSLSRLPAVDGSQLTNLPSGSNVNVIVTDLSLAPSSSSTITHPADSNSKRQVSVLEVLPANYPINSVPQNDSPNGNMTYMLPDGVITSVKDRYNNANFYGPGDALNESAGWLSATTSSWWQIQFTSPRIMVQANWQQATYGNCYDYIWKASNDGTNWTTLATVTSNTSRTLIDSFSNTGSFIYYRIEVQSSSYNGYNLATIKALSFTEIVSTSRYQLRYDYPIFLESPTSTVISNPFGSTKNLKVRIYSY